MKMGKLVTTFAAVTTRPTDSRVEKGRYSLESKLSDITAFMLIVVGGAFRPAEQGRMSKCVKKMRHRHQALAKTFAVQPRWLSVFAAVSSCREVGICWALGIFAEFFRGLLQNFKNYWQPGKGGKVENYVKWMRTANNHFWNMCSHKSRNRKYVV